MRDNTNLSDNSAWDGEFIDGKPGPATDSVPRYVSPDAGLRQGYPARWKTELMQVGTPAITARELERNAWRSIYTARAASDRNRRRLLMQEAFDLVKRAGILRQLESGETHIAPFAEGYQLRLSNGEGGTLWINLDVESRVEAAWAASALATACAEEYEDFNLWDGSTQLPGREILSIFADSSEGVAAGTQQAVLDLEEMLLRTHEKLARSRTLLKATALLRRQLTLQEQ